MIADVLAQAAPLLLATLGALASEYAGVLAVFMEGAIAIAAFACASISYLTGNATLGVAGAALTTMILLYAVARFTERTRANPFITGIAVNFLATGIIPQLSLAWFGTRGVVALPPAVANASGVFRMGTVPVSFALALLSAVFLATTGTGLALRVSGRSPDALAARGLDAARYRSLSWVIAAFFAALAGSALTLGLGAYVPSIGAGRGWTALAAVFLGYRNPILAIPAVLAFSLASYLTDVLQGAHIVPGSLILGLPYALALAAFVVARGNRRT